MSDNSTSDNNNNKSKYNQRIYQPAYRTRKAYWTALVVMMSYFKLYLLSKIRGKKYYEKHILSLHIQNANRIKKAILELKGLFIKAGQLLSILSNFLPEAFQEPLAALQDQIPARPYAEIKEQIERELGKSPEELFDHFEKNAIASASIGQVHIAQISDKNTGKKKNVAVKVQHKNIETIAETDLTIIQNLTKLITRFFDIQGLDYAYTQVRQMIEEELNFSKEAQAMVKIRENLKGETGISIPKVHSAYCTSKILTTTFYEGVKINNVRQIEEWQLDKTELVKRLLHAYCQMVFEDGYYHADPHPGNILIQQDGTIVLLDFGAVASLRPEMRNGLLQLLEAAVKNDNAKIIAALQTMGFIGEDKETEKIAQKVIDAFRNFLQNEVEFDGMNLKEIKINPFKSSLFGLINDIGIKSIANTVQVPKDYVLLNRMLSLLMGICNSLDSHFNPMEVVQPYFQKYLLGEKGDMVKFITRLLQQSITNALSLPGDMRKVLNLMQNGELIVQTQSSDNKTKLWYIMLQQIIFTLLFVSATFFTYTFYSSGEQKLFNYSAILSFLFAFLLIRAMWKGRNLLD